jgi:hypothetical protein
MLTNKHELAIMYSEQMNIRTNLDEDIRCHGEDSNPLTYLAKMKRGYLITCLVMN